MSGLPARTSACGSPDFSLCLQTSKDLEFMVEAQTVERVADVLQRLVNLHNRSVCISSWKEVWSACRASIDQSTGKKCLATRKVLSLHFFSRVRHCYVSRMGTCQEGATMTSTGAWKPSWQQP